MLSLDDQSLYLLTKLVKVAANSKNIAIALYRLKEILSPEELTIAINFWLGTPYLPLLENTSQLITLIANPANNSLSWALRSIHQEFLEKLNTLLPQTFPTRLWDENYTNNWDSLFKALENQFIPHLLNAINGTSNDLFSSFPDKSVSLQEAISIMQKKGELLSFICSLDSKDRHHYVVKFDELFKVIFEEKLISLEMILPYKKLLTFITNSDVCDESKRLLIRYCDLSILNTFRISALEEFVLILNGEEKQLEQFIQDRNIPLKDILEKFCRKDNEIINLATTELYATNLVSTGSICEGYVRRVTKCYPVYNSGYRDLLEPIQNYLRQIDRIIPIGRYGSFKYNNQDHSILMGLVAAENLLTGESTDLWAINTDYEYQESARITSTGLVHE
jgi:hypothetical protein